MIYQKLPISIIAVILGLTALSNASYTCDGETIYHSGNVCGKDGNVYTPQDLCTAFGTFNTWDYSKVAIVDDCTILESCNPES